MLLSAGYVVFTLGPRLADVGNHSGFRPKQIRLFQPRIKLIISRSLLGERS